VKVEVGFKFEMTFLTQQLVLSIFYPNLGWNNPACLERVRESVIVNPLLIYHYSEYCFFLYIYFNFFYLGLFLIIWEFDGIIIHFPCTKNRLRRSV